jgi:amino acid adenylation domain-containing protein
VVAKVDLRLMVVDDGGPLRGAVEFATALFDRSWVQRLVGHLGVLLAAVAVDPGARLSVLPVLSAAQRRQLLSGWNDTARPVPQVAGAHQLVLARAAGQPAVTAVRCGQESLSYRDLAARAGRLARFLRGLGVGPETVVGLYLPRGVDAVVAALGVWLAGGAYLPLDPDYPVDRLMFMLTDSRASVVLGTGDLLDDLPAGRARTVALDDPAVTTALAQPPTTAPPDPGTHPDRLAYVIYTSGSTGTPKGVQITHRGVLNLIEAQSGAFGIEPAQPVLQFASTSFDAAVSETWVSLATGATLIVATTQDRNDPHRLTTLIRRHQVQVATLPPSLLALLTPTDLTTLTTLISAGEELPTALARTWAAQHRLLNAYGPTETSVCATIATIQPVEPVEPATSTAPVLPIGTPIANTRVYVLDANLRPVPVGVSGDLFIAGLALARGYRNRPALTAHHFIADPFTTPPTNQVTDPPTNAPGARMYRTGDRARWRPDGQLEFLGRTDRQVKIRGIRIETGEIETALTTHPAIRTAVVTTDGQGPERRLLAYLVPTNHHDGLPPSTDLRTHLRTQLPDYMIPTSYTELTALPLTPNGKINHTALPTPTTRPDQATTQQAPEGPTEELLTRIWADILHTDQIGATDDFFDLGGHSLLATQVTSRIGAMFGVELQLSALFDTPTVRALADLIEGRILAEVEHMTEREVLDALDPGSDNPMPDEDGVH